MAANTSDELSEVVTKPPVASPLAIAEDPVPSVESENVNEKASAKRDALILASLMGCDCPIPPPTDIGSMYTAEGVEDWLDGLADRCPQFSEREMVVDCSEFPCILLVEETEDDINHPLSMEKRVLCREEGLLPDEPEAVFVGSAGGDDEMYHIVSIRRQENQEYRSREWIRQTEILHRFREQNAPPK